jgi:hypothetical protein
MHPQPRVQKGKKHTSVVTTVTPEITRHSPRNGFNKLLRALPGEPGLFATVASGYRFRQLDTSAGVSGPHDFAVRETAPFVSALPASIASRPASVTIASRPSGGTGRRVYSLKF